MTSDWMGVFALLIIISLPFLIYSHVTRTGRDRAEQMEREAARVHRIDLSIATIGQRLEAVRAWQAGKVTVDTRNDRTATLNGFDFLTEQANRFIARGEITAAIEVLEARLPLDREEDRSWLDPDEPWDDPPALQVSYERLALLVRLEVVVGHIDRSLTYLGRESAECRNDEVENSSMMPVLLEALAICERLEARALADQLRARCAKAGMEIPDDPP
jgi:hypothetical protein